MLDMLIGAQMLTPSNDCPGLFPLSETGGLNATSPSPSPPLPPGEWDGTIRGILVPGMDRGLSSVGSTLPVGFVTRPEYLVTKTPF